MTEYTFFVPGAPKVKQRPRKGKNGHFYTPEPTRTWERMVAWAFKTAYPDAAPLQGDVLARLSFTFSSKPRGDTDNYIKAVLDGCNGLAYVDDRQVTAIESKRMIGEPEGVLVTFKGV